MPEVSKLPVAVGGWGPVDAGTGTTAWRKDENFLDSSNNQKHVKCLVHPASSGSFCLLLIFLTCLVCVSGKPKLMWMTEDLCASIWWLRIDLNLILLGSCRNHGTLEVISCFYYFEISGLGNLWILQVGKSALSYRNHECGNVITETKHSFKASKNISLIVSWCIWNTANFIN